MPTVFQDDLEIEVIERPDEVLKLDDNMNLVTVQTGSPSLWHAWNPKRMDGISTIIDTLETVKAAARELTGGMSTILSIVKTILDAMTQFLLVAVDAEAEIIKAAIATVRSLLEELFAENAVGMLVVPPATLWVPFQEADEYVTSDDPGLGAPYTFRIATDQAKPGGNFGFYAQVDASLKDVNDPFRPQYSQEAYVAGAVLLAGADTFVEILPLIRKLYQLLSNPGGKSNSSENLSPMYLPCPKNLEYEVVLAQEVSAAETIAKRASTDHRMAVRLLWDPNDPTYTVGDGENQFTAVIDRVKVYRHTEPLSRSMPDNELEKYLYADEEFDLFAHRFYDEDVTPGETYYYAVGYTISPEDPPEGYTGTGQDVPYELMTARVHVPEEPPWTRKGVPPDWTSLPSLFHMIPGVKSTVNEITLFLDALEKRLDSKNDKITAYIRSIEREIQRYSDWANRVIDTINQIIDALTLPDVYIGSHTFYGKGGNTFFLNDLNRALNSSEDPNWPPFDKGYEITCGLVFMIGSETAGSIEKIWNLLQMFFGEEGKLADSAGDLYKSAMDSINAVIGETERQICFEDSLLETLCADEESTGGGFDSQLNPSYESTECTES